MPACAALPQDVTHHVHRDRIESGERLVQHQDVRVVDEGSRELHALLVAEAELLDRITRPLGDSESLEPGGHPAAGHVGPQTVQLREVEELLADPHLGIEAALLRHVTDAAPQLGRQRLTAPGDPP